MYNRSDLCLAHSSMKNCQSFGACVLSSSYTKITPSLFADLVKLLFIRRYKYLLVCKDWSCWIVAYGTEKHTMEKKRRLNSDDNLPLLAFPPRLPLSPHNLLWVFAGTNVSDCVHVKSRMKTRRVGYQYGHTQATLQGKEDLRCHRWSSIVSTA